MAYSSVTEILPGLWLGDTSVAHNDVFLKEKQIQFIINCSDEAKYPNNPAIKIKYRIQFAETYTSDDCLQICRLIDEYCNLVKNNINSYNILVYCSTGNRHSLIIIISYIIKYGMLDLSTAIECVKSKRVSTHNEINDYIPLLKVYQKLLRR